MDFFSVWWYDLVLALAVLPQVVRFFSFASRFVFLSVISVAMQLVSIVLLPFIGGELTDVLLVLMLFAAVSSGLAFLETRLDERKAGEEVETP
jgi:hypothetical protein